MKPVVLIEWRDAEDAEQSWMDLRDAEEFGDRDCEAVSIGFLIRKTDKYVTLGSDFDLSNQTYGTVRKIPTTMILSMKEIST